MKGYNIWLPINRKDKFIRQEGYVLGITLILLTLALLFVASFLKRQVYHEDWTKTLQQTASKRLVAQNCLVSNKDEVMRRYEKTFKEVFKAYEAVHTPTGEDERQALKTLAAAKAYLLVSQSFFYNLPSQADLDNYYLIIQSFSFRTPHLERDHLTQVKSYSYPQFLGSPTILSKAEFISYEALYEKVKEVEESLTKDRSHDEVIDEGEQDEATQNKEIQNKEIEDKSIMDETIMNRIRSIGEEIEKKTLYEIMVELKVTNRYSTIIDKEKMYLTLILESNEDDQLPYKLSVDKYVLDCK